MRIASGSSLQLGLILPLGMNCLSAASIRFVRRLLAVSRFWGGSEVESAFSMYSVKFSQSAFRKFV